MLSNVLDIEEKKSIGTHFLAALRGKRTEFTQGAIGLAIFYLAVPMVAELLIEGLFAVVDIYCLSFVSQDAVSVVGITESVMFIVYSLAIGLGMGATAMVARRTGESDTVGASHAAAQAVLLGLIVSALIAILGVGFAEPMLRLFADEENLVRVGVPYVRIMMGTNAVIVFLFLFNSIFRGTGEAKYAMWALALSSTLNIVLDVILIFGLGPFPELGLRGAAIATSIGRGVGVLLQLYLLLRSRTMIRWVRTHFIPQVKILSRLVQVSAGGILQFAIESLSWIFLTYLVVQFGSETRSGYFIAFRIVVFSILPSWGIANAAATLVGQNLGARQYIRAEASVWTAAKYNTIFLIFSATLFFLISRPLVAAFMDDPIVIQQGVRALRIISIAYIFLGYGMVVGQSFNGAGDTWTPTLWNFVVFWLIQIPLAWILSRWIGPEGIYLSIAISTTLIAIILVVKFRQGHWKNIQI